MIVSEIAQNIVGSEIIKLSQEVQARIASGQKIHNLTIGDFDPKQFPIPAALKGFIIDELNNDQTNYPVAEGMPELRDAVSKYLYERSGLSYKRDEILIAAGARPIIYTIFKTLVDSKDRVLFATPSWNNNHYTGLMDATPAWIVTTPENRFMPTAKEIEKHINVIQLLCLCSPQNPTGTAFNKAELKAICDVVLAENKRRGPKEKPVYVMYDQIYWMLTTSDGKHFDPVTLRPEMKEYTIFVDGISKSLSATGIRVGWTMGPKFIINKMKSILSHIGAWAPRAEQLATARFIGNGSLHDQFMIGQRAKVENRIWGLYNGLCRLRHLGYGVDVIPPTGGIYLSVKFGIKGKVWKGKEITTTADITNFLLEAGIAMVPFYAFGSDKESNWYRASIGTISEADVPAIIKALSVALIELDGD